MLMLLWSWSSFVAAAVRSPQVEHPVTEGITGVNLPASQLMVGCGIPLWRMPAIRALYGQDPKGREPFDLEATSQRPPDGHVVAVRITSENANNGFKPTCGRIDELLFRPTPEVRARLVAAVRVCAWLCVYVC